MLGEDGLEVAFEEGAGVLEVLFCVGFRGGDALKRSVQDTDDPPLLWKRGNGNGVPVNKIFGDTLVADRTRHALHPRYTLLDSSLTIKNLILAQKKV